MAQDSVRFPKGSNAARGTPTGVGGAARSSGIATLTASQSRCLSAILAGVAMKSRIAIKAGLDLRATAAALSVLGDAGLIERKPDRWDWQPTRRGEGCRVSTVPDPPSSRRGGAGSLRAGSAAARLIKLLQRPMRGRELARRLGVSLQRIHQIVVRELAARRLRVGDRERPLLIVALSGDRSVLLNEQEERMLSAMPEAEPTTVPRVSRRISIASDRVTSLIESLRLKGLVARAGDERGRPSYRLTPAGAGHVQRRFLRKRAEPIRLPVKSDRVGRVLEYLAAHGPTRTRDIGLTLGIPSGSMNALMQYLKRRGLARKTGRLAISPHALTQQGPEILAAMRRRAAGDAEITTASKRSGISVVRRADSIQRRGISGSGVARKTK